MSDGITVQADKCLIIWRIVHYLRTSFFASRTGELDTQWEQYPGRLCGQNLCTTSVPNSMSIPSKVPICNDSGGKWINILLHMQCVMLLYRLLNSSARFKLGVHPCITKIISFNFQLREICSDIYYTDFLLRNFNSGTFFHVPFYPDKPLTETYNLIYNYKHGYYSSIQKILW